MYKNDIGLKIHIVSRQIKRKMDMVVNKYHLTSVQSAILGYIYRKSKKDKVYAKDIEKEFDMRRATAAGILQLMEKQELIEREKVGNDARLKSIVLTKKALEIQNEIQKVIRENEKKIRKDLSKEEINEFLRILSKMSKNIN